MKKLFKIYLGIKLNSSDLIFIGYYLKSHKRILFRRILIARFKHISNKYNIEIPLSFNNIGENLLLAHANNITVNSRAKIGDNCILFKGCTIGSIRSGKREGVPIIGNNVVIGINAFCGGGVVIGDNVFIAPNSYVNFDVPSNSIVLGNPGIIHHKDDSTKDYIK